VDSSCLRFRHGSRWTRVRTTRYCPCVPAVSVCTRRTHSHCPLHSSSSTEAGRVDDPSLPFPPSALRRTRMEKAADLRRLSLRRSVPFPSISPSPRRDERGRSPAVHGSRTQQRRRRAGRATNFFFSLASLACEIGNHSSIPVRSDSVPFSPIGARACCCAVLFEDWRMSDEIQ
jgi:hypothetical protein